MAPRIGIVGAGPGGLTSAMILAHRGYDVDVFEKEATLGGRNASLQLGDYTFDVGPTFLMMTFILREVFEHAGKNLDDYCTVIPLDPMYRLDFGEISLEPSAHHEKMRAQIARLFPGEEEGFDRLLKREKSRYEYMYPCLQRPYSTAGSMLSKTLLRAVPHLSMGKSLYGVLSDYFQSEELKTAFTFQAKYIGMSPWQCPGLYTMIPYVEHAFGIDHVTGGLSAISEAMAQVTREHGGKIYLSTPVKQIETDSKKRARGVILESGERHSYDAVIVNADFGYAATNLFAPGVIRKWQKKTLDKKKYSCSTFMLYLGLDTLYDEPHHQIVFAEDYKANIGDIVSEKRLSDDMSIYIRNASKTDPTLAPKGHSALYILVPVSNTRAPFSWDEKRTREYRRKILDRIIARTGMKDLESHIVEEKCLTPDMWEHEFNLFDGSTFNLGHNLSQMLYLRPRNKFEEVGNCYLVGGGTHPGSGLPTIYESGKISANLVSEEYPLS
ncbi:phytoene desaturase family protein [Chitinivibrio alkaliphilus]|uniref:Phytoene desaturase n=1 Tax=Chitinivibrio alkaliphilus ACht1 TaxID=1313304 RepID=U7DCP6_9BACT|nr:phytoene desaturase family protein [Chitinivibrio alkaliphilus]ERP38671.1 phytoene desaturase [Chitinivibrio alkaliphilus ACht1]